MDWRKVVFLESSFSALSSRQRVVSGFCLGITFSLLVFFLLSYGSSPVSNSIFSSPTSLFPWFFSSPDPGSGSRSDLIGKDSNVENAQVGNFPVLAENSTGLEKTHEGNSSSGGTGAGNNPSLGRDSAEETHDSNSTRIPYTGTESGDEDSSRTGKDYAIEETHFGGHPENAESSLGLESSGGNGNGSLPVTPAMPESSGGNGNGSLPVPPAMPEQAHVVNVTKDDTDSMMFEKKDGAKEKADPKEVRFDRDGKNASRDTGKGMAIEARNETKSSDSMKAKGELSENCNIFDGRWVRDENMPFYPPITCPYIDMDFNCHKNGRPDEDFLKWRWQPYGCNIPRLNATDFLERLRGQRLIFVGDSLNRNMWESLVCILRHSVKHKKRVYEVSGKSNFKTRGYYSFRFEDYKCNVDFVRSPFLVRELSLQNVNGLENEKLRLDLLDETTAAYHGADIVVFNTGHWWTHEKTSKGVDYYQEGSYVYPILKVMEAFEKALNTWAGWIDKNIDSKRTRVFFRGYSLTHFRGGQWNSGGQCHKETEPIFNETYLEKYPQKMQVLEKVLKQMKTPVVYLNVSKMTDYRKDGHPSIYRKEYKTVEEQIAAEKTQDCSHWCLPGVPDSWNELLYASLLMDGRGSWKR